jgi:RNA polymerase sigma-70 factor (ECF subfamily)
MKRWGDLAAAEDALSEAFAEALRDWPRRGVPNQPEGWLLQVARRRLVDGLRRSSTGRRLQSSLPTPLACEDNEPDGNALPDERLELMMLCAHPSLEASVRVPLMLQAVMGISAHRLARGFALSAANMSCRLVRAKKKIKQNKIRFEVDSFEERQERLGSMLEGLYLAFSLESDCLGEKPAGQSLRHEISHLLDLLLHLWGSEPELLGLASLVSFQLARERSRLDADGNWVALGDQDIGQWDLVRLRKAEALLHQAHQAARPGRYQLEAAVESAYVHGRLTGRSNWPDVLALYQALEGIAPCLGVRVAAAGAHLQSGSPTAALARLQAMDPSSVQLYQPYWATLAAVWRALERSEQARAAEVQARELAHGQAQRLFLDRLSSREP